MSDELRFVFDTNIIVSAALFKTSIPRQALNLARTTGKLLMSWPTMTELQDVLNREKLDKYITEEERMLFLEALARESMLIEVTETIVDCRDPKDNKFLELALSGNATCIASGDDDLLVLNPFRGIPILTSQEFLNHIWL